MKPVLLHGPAINNSRTKLVSLKQRFDTNNVVVYESGSSIQEIMGGSMTLPLLSEERLIILENPDESFIDYTADFYTLVFWFDHTVTEKKPILEWVKKNGQVVFFPEEKEVSVFPLLDRLAIKDSKAFLEIQKLKKGGFDIFYFLTMTFYLLRNLSVTPKNAPQFVRQKLDRQRKNFDLEKITKLYKEILEIDFKLKSGLLEKEQAEFLLVNKFIVL